jgi:prepilin-type processing-associated H-X9-DG protein
MTESNKRFINGIPYYLDKDTEEEEKGFWLVWNINDKKGVLLESDGNGNVTWYDGHGNITHTEKRNDKET